MPLYNAQKFVVGTIDSVLTQTFHDFELVISDNGSTDRTEQICREYARRDSRIRYYRNDVNRGAAWNHNRVLELARGEYFKWNSYDDRLAPEFLEKCVAVLDATPEAVLAFSKFVDVDANGNQLRTKSPVGMWLRKPHERFQQLIRRHHTCEEVYGLVRLDVMRQTPGIAPYAISDKVLIVELALRGVFAEVPEVLFFHGWHGDNMGLQNPDARDQHVWFNPGDSGRLVFPHWRIFGEYIRLLRRVRLPFGERLRCYSHLLSCQWQYRRDLYKDFSNPAWESLITFAKKYLPWTRTPWRKWKGFLESIRMSAAFRTRRKTR
jgi:glycosyltransferase involved in cell wall biosynthesis